MAASLWRDRVLVVLAVLVSTLPFVHKAFHIDDVYFLGAAHEASEHPLDPLSGTGALLDEDYKALRAAHREPSLFEGFVHPPLFPYVLAALSSLSSGPSEVDLHLLTIAFAIAGSLALLRLARRFSPHPLPAVLAAVLAPPFVIAAHSVMTDIPALALSVAGLALFVDAVDRDRWPLGLWAGFLLGLAALTRYACLSAPLVTLAYALPSRRSLWHWFGATAAMAATLSPWAAQNLAWHHALHPWASMQIVQIVNEGRHDPGWTLRSLSDLSGLGASLAPLALAGLFLGRRRGRGLLRLLISALATAPFCLANVLGLKAVMSMSLEARSALWSWVTLGVLALVEATANPSDDKKAQRFLICWLLVSVATAIVVLPFGTVRYMIPALPPLALLLSRSGWFESRRGLALGLLGTFVTAALLATADMRYADTYRDYALTWKAHRPVWFVGDWGFRYYMSSEGHRFLLSTDESPVGGDLIVRPRTAALHDMSPRLRARVRPLRTDAVPGSFPLRMMNADDHAGYYSHGWGLLPFAVSRSPLETFDVFEVANAPGE